MEDVFNVANPMARCAACGTEVPPGHEMISTLSCNGLDFERKDFCESCFANVGREELYSFWRTRVVEKTEKPRQKTIDARLVEDLFRRMLEEADPQKEGLLFLLAMILDRKHVIRYRGTRDEAGKKFAVFAKPKARKTFTIPYPDMEPEKLEAMREDLKKLLEVDDA